MKARHLHDCQVTTGQARRIQESLAGQVSRENELGEVKLIAGVDISARSPRGMARAAVVVLRYPELSLVEVRTVEKMPIFPYIPGLLSFREAPLIVEACAQLQNVPDLVLADGQGIAHPRRFGLASHVGLLLDTPTIGCAKSRLIGEHDELGLERGAWTELRDGQEVIGAVLRTRAGVAPLYVSIGHKIDLQSAMQWVLQCCCDKRLPEPIRLAHLAAGGRQPETGVGQKNGQTCAHDDSLIKYLKH